MLELTLKHNAILTHINGRKECHGDDRVTAVDLDFSAEIKDAIADRFCMADEYFSDMLWCDDEEKSVRFPQISGAFSIGLKYDSHQVKLFSPLLDDSPALLVMNQCKLVKFKMKPKDGGVAALTFQVQGEVADNEEIGKLFNEFLGSEVKLDIKPQQTDLVTEANEQAQSETGQADEESDHPEQEESAA